MGFVIIKGGKVWEKGHFVENQELVYETKGADRILNLEEKDRIVPGVIDFHAHLWSPSTVTPFGVDAEEMYSEGVVGGIDAGSFGVDNWKKADEFWRNECEMNVKSFLSILPEGLAVFPPENPPLPEDIDTEDMIRKLNALKNDRLLGMKVQLGWLSYKSPETDRELLKRARYIADSTGTKMMVHMSGTCLEMEEMVSYFKEGDIITHVYSGFPNTVLDSNGIVSPAIKEAATRGVWMDMGHAGKHFSWDVFRKAYEQGLKFNTLGGDITTFSWKNREKFKIYDIFHLLSGVLNAGVSEEEVFRALIDNPADYMKQEMSIEKQCLVLEWKEAHSTLEDGLGEVQNCSFEYVPKLFFK